MYLEVIAKQNQNKLTTGQSLQLNCLVLLLQVRSLIDFMLILEYILKKTLYLFLFSIPLYSK